MGTEALGGPAVMLEEYRALALRLNRMSAELGAMRVSARSSDGCVTATVGPTGELADVSIDADLGADLDLGTIARRVVEAAAIAANEARGRRLDAVSTILPDHLRGMVSELAERGDL